MAFFGWNDNLSVGVQACDDDHKKLIDMLNRLYEGMRQNLRQNQKMEIILDNGTWKVINHEGRTLDATRTRVEAEESVAILEQFPEYGGRWP